MLAREHEVLRERLVAYHDGLQGEVAAVSERLHDEGVRAFQKKE
jgi:5-(carboxyamino)imidazole ribonucleotide mutase